MSEGRPRRRSAWLPGSDLAWPILLAAAVCFPAASPAEAALPATARVLVVGDSNAVGVGETPAFVWTNRLERSEAVFVQVLGAPGATLGHPAFGSLQLAGCVRASEGFTTLRAAILALGTNDFMAAVPLADVRAGVRAIIDALAAPWICITPPGRGNEQVRNQIGLTAQDYRDAIAAECAALGATIVRGEVVVPGDSSMLRDGLHLNRVGHRQMFRAARDALRHALLPRPTPGSQGPPPP